MRYTDKEHSLIQDGDKYIPCVPGNRDYDELVEKGLLKEVVAYVAPVVIITYTPEELFDEFTKEQWAAIRKESKVDIEVEYLMDKLQTRNSPISVDNKMLVDGLNYLVSKKLITQREVERILGGN